MMRLHTQHAADHFMREGFADRQEAGRELAVQLGAYRDAPGLLVLGLPRGGVPVAYEVASALDAELDVLIVRKLGVPHQPEFAMGAIASGGAIVLNEAVIDEAGLTRAHVDAVLHHEQAELARRESLYRGDRSTLDIRGRTVIVVDDGLATGASMRAAVIALRSLQPMALIVAVPVAPPGSAELFTGIIDEFVCLQTPRDFHAVGWWYRDFDQVSDDEVRSLLAQSRDLRAKERPT